MGLIESLERINKKKSSKELKVAVVKAADKAVLESIKHGLEMGMIIPTLIDDETEIRRISKEIEVNLDDVIIIDESDDKKAAAKGVELVRDKKVGALMKGFIGTGDLLRAVVNKETGIRSSDLLSHVAVVYVPELERFVAITDGGMVVEPDKEQLKTILLHGVEVMQSVQVSKPKVALLSASENVMAASEVSVWSKELTEELADEEDFVAEGPISLDLSLVPKIARAKGYEGKIKGDADIIVTPDIVTGNSLAKSLTLFGGSEMAGLIIGAQVPIILTSRTSSSDEKYASMLLAQQVMEAK